MTAAREAAAALFGVAPERMERAAVVAATAHQELMTVFTPFAHWWEALDVPYPGDLNEPPVLEIERGIAR